MMLVNIASKLLEISTLDQLAGASTAYVCKNCKPWISSSLRHFAPNCSNLVEFET